MLMSMENDIATSEQSGAPRHNQKQRLKDQAEALLRAFEALGPPQTYAEADRAAKALISINKALDQIHGPEPEPLEPPYVAPVQDYSNEPEALQSSKRILDRKLERLENIRRANANAARSAPALSP